MTLKKFFFSYYLNMWKEKSVYLRSKGAGDAEKIYHGMCNSTLYYGYESWQTYFWNFYFFSYISAKLPDGAV